MPGHQALVLERVQQRDHRRAVDAQPLRDLQLGKRLTIGDNEQYPQFAPVDAERRKRLRRQLRQLLLCMLEQVAQPPAQLRARPAIVRHRPSLSLC